MSMQEEQARRDAVITDAPQASEPSAADTTSGHDPAPSSSTAEGAMDEDEEAQLAAALALSQGEDLSMADDEEDEIQQAIRLMNPDTDNDNKKD